MTKGDFNGDGIADLAIGAPGETVATIQSCSFNFTCTTVDHAGAGAVNILLGSATNGLTRPTPGSPSVLQGAHVQDGGHFGRALASGNFRGNTTSDLAVVSPGVVHNGRTIGSLNIFFSSPAGGGLLAVQPSQEFFADDFSGANTVLGGLVRFTFPENVSMTWGQFNGDSFGDLAVELSVFGAPNPRSAVLVLYGSASGFNTSSYTVLVVDDGLSPNNFINPDPNGNCGRLHFCATSRGHVTVAAGDLDGDGKHELLIGAPNCNEVDDDGATIGPGTDGCVAIVPGNAGRLTIFGWGALRPGNEDKHHGFGLALAIGDFDKDGRKDVAVGAPDASFEAPSAGSVRIFRSVSAGGNGTGEVSFTLITQNTPGIETAEANDRFGAALAANDFNGDGATDLAIGAPGESTGTLTSNGEVNILFGLAGTGLSTTASTGHPAAVKVIGGNSGESMGSGLSAWNFGLSTEADLAIGSPHRDLVYIDPTNGIPHTIAGAGAVPVLFGSSQTSTGFQGVQVWVQQAPGIPVTGPFTTSDVARSGNQFGAAVY